MDQITPEALKSLLLGSAEFALIDVREQGVFSEAHLLFAVCIPLSQLELSVGDLVPRRETPIVLVDESDDAQADVIAAARLAQFGYSDVRRLAGGIAGWRAAGFELFSGVNVPSKAFGEFVETTYDTPRLPADEVKALLDAGEDMVIVDSRPYEEFHRMSIPSGVDMPGAELVYRIHDHAPNPDTLVVVNCAGRTRSIIGAQSLINAGIPNRVVALKDGTMGWHLAGHELAHGETEEAAAPSEAGLAAARAAAARVAERFGVRTASAATVRAWREEADRTTYLLDVRSPGEYADSHRRGFRNAPGGQLVQATDEYVAVKNARLVLADDVGVRATMTASWLIQMGWTDVWVADPDDPAEVEQGVPTPTVLGVVGDASISTAALEAALERSLVIDLGPSTRFAQRHIPGAVWCPRARLAQALDLLEGQAQVVLTSPDGLLARLALAEARSLTEIDVHALEGGTDRWLAEARTTEAGIDRAVGETNDVWYKPYEHRAAQEKFMRDYLTWEVALVEQLERDGTTQFRTF